MKRLVVGLCILLLGTFARAQLSGGGVNGGPTVIGLITPGHCAEWWAVNVLEDSGGVCGTGSAAFSAITSGTNTTTLNMGTGGVLTPTGGIINANEVGGAPIPASAAVIASNGSSELTAATTTGTGSTVVLANSATLVAPALGTPVSGVATNLSGLPLSGIVNQSAYTLPCNATAISAGLTDCTLSPNLAFVSSVLSPTQPVDPNNSGICVSASTYTFAASDQGALVEFCRSSAVAVTIPLHSTTGFGAQWSVDTYNYGSGTVTFTPTSPDTINNGGSSLTEPPNTGCTLTINNAGNIALSACSATGGSASSLLSSANTWSGKNTYTGLIAVNNGTSYSGASWTTNGIAGAIGAATYNDSTGSGVIATEGAWAWQVPTISATNTVTITNLYNALFAAPATGANVTATYPWSTLDTGVKGILAAPAANTQVDGLWLIDEQVATNNNQYYSPCERFTGSGWKTNTTAGPQTVDWRICLIPIQGGPNPTDALTFTPQTAGGGFNTAVLTLQPGLMTVGGGITASGTVLINASQNSAFSANTGSSTGPVTLGGGSNTITLDAEAGGLTLSNLGTGTNADFLCLSSAGVVLVQTSACTISSLRFKEDVVDMQGSALPELGEMEVASFRMKQSGTNADPNAGSRQVGLIAENIAQVAPECAIYENDMKTPKSYRQECVIALLVRASQEQQHEISELKRRLNHKRR